MSAQADHAYMGLQAERRSIMDERTVLCAASAYEQKFYINPEFETLPESIRQELQIMCVLYTEDVGGVLMVVFDEDGNLELQVDHEENDFTFDEIGSVLKIKELQQTKRELFDCRYRRAEGIDSLIPSKRNYSDPVQSHSLRSPTDCRLYWHYYKWCPWL